MKEIELGHLKTYKMKLTTLSPVFIGGGEKLSNLDYFYNFSTGELKLIDESKFSKFLLENNLFFITGFIIVPGLFFNILILGSVLKKTSEDLS